MRRGIVCLVLAAGLTITAQRWWPEVPEPGEMDLGASRADVVLPIEPQPESPRSADKRTSRPEVIREAVPSPEPSPSPARLARPAVLGAVPLAFESFPADASAVTPADGQFIARGPGYLLTLGGNGVELSLGSSADDTRSALVRLSFAGAIPGVVAEGEGTKIPTHYFIGSDPDGWRPGRNTFDRVRYRSLYPGVDVVYYGRAGEVEFDLEFAAGSNPNQVALTFAGVDDVRLENDGDLSLRVGHRTIRQRKPVAYQSIDTVRVPVDAAYRLDGSTVGFDIGAFDRSYPLVVDPVLSYSGYLGGSGDDEGFAIAVDGAGNTYVAGETWSPNFPRLGPGTWSRAGASDVLLMKLGANGVIEYSTYLGGASMDAAEGLAVDQAGNVFIAGTTASDDFPVAGALQSANGGGFDAFVAKLDPTGGRLLYSTYLGGLDMDEASAIAVDGSGVATLVGQTFSTNFPTSGAFQGSLAGGLDAFVARLAPLGDQLVYSTYLGGTAADRAGGIALDAAGRALVVGATSSSDFPVLVPYQAAAAGGADAFVTSLAPNGSSLVWSTYLGGSLTDVAHAVALDAFGQPYVVGSTASTDFPLQGPLQTANRGGFDAFLASFGVDGQTVRLSTYLGGSRLDSAHGVAFDGAGDLYVTGETKSSDFPSVAAMQPALSGTRDVFLTKLTPTAAAMIYSTYFGSPAREDSAGFAVDAGGVAYVTGAVTRAVAGPTGRSDLLVAAIAPSQAQVVDTDGDQMPNDWEAQFGLDPANPSDAAQDPDGDGVSNLDEYRRGTHPRGFYTRYLAEGATTDFFDVSLALANPNAPTATALLQFLRPTGSPVTQVITVGGLRRVTIDPETLTGLSGTSFSTVVETDVPLIVDRTMTWDVSGYGSHAETSTDGPATTWYLAEGATHSGFDLFYLIQNPNPSVATVTVTYLLPSPAAPVQRVYSVPAGSRFNIWVDSEAATFPVLASTAVSARLQSDVPIIVERAMYLNSGGQTFGAGHDSAGVTAPSTTWFLAEGATGPYFDLFILIANPTATDAVVDVQYLLQSGTTVTKRYTVAANSRFDIWVDQEDALLADAAVSSTVTSINGVPIIVERSMWWPGPTPASWQEAHNSPGATVTGTKWAVAEGEQGGSRGTSTYLLVANTSAYPGQVRVTLLFENQAPLVVGPSATIPGHSRYNVDLGAAAFIAARDRRFGAIVESLAVQGETAPAQIVVERAMYSDAGGVTWAAGTNALATRLPGDTTIVIGADGAVRPANLLVNAGGRVTFLNLDGVAHDVTSDPHPDHTDCPAINEVGLLQPGQSQQTGNLVFAGTCGFHDHDQPFNDLLQGTIVIR